jgi:DNA polymerase I-like protein with 3'-5' exonuclease and polymerase domains
MHTASFDSEVTAKACGFDFHHMIEAGRILDVGILFRLLSTAKTGDVPGKYNLAVMTKNMLGVELNKDETIRKGFGEFLKQGVVDYKAIPAESLAYAAHDAIATFELGQRLEEECCSVQQDTFQQNSGAFGPLGHNIQIKGDIALRAIEHVGVGVDLVAVEKLDQALVKGIEESKAVLARFGYIPSQPGTKMVFNQIVAPLARERGVILPVTPKSGDICQAANALAPLADNEFVAAFLEFKEREKLRSTYVSHLREAGGRIFPHYNLLVRTGRTSCSSPNIQNLPRIGGVRECLVAAPGHVLIACDYSTLELCALAQICYGRYGQSHMRDLINQGVDLHRYVAAKILNKPESEVTKDERQRGKAVSFGLPGGMGAKGLRAYALASYGVSLTLEEAESWRTAWINLFPEMQLYLAKSNTLELLGAELDIDSFPGGQVSPETAAAIVMRVAGGKTDTSTGRIFSSDEVEWAWKQIENNATRQSKPVREMIESRQGSWRLQREIVPGATAIISTGRMRTNCSFTEEHNLPFQGLSADGAKLALYRLYQAGYRVVSFIHDEVLVEVSERDDYREPAEDISRIMVAAMREVCPDVVIKTEYAAMRRWDKSAKAIHDAKGRLIPYGDPLLSNDTNETLNSAPTGVERSRHGQPRSSPAS